MKRLQQGKQPLRVVASRYREARSEQQGEAAAAAAMVAVEAVIMSFNKLS
jgi:hypothetical protein